MRASTMVKVLAPMMAAGVLLGVAGCASTQQVPEARRSGFLGDYSMLRKEGIGRGDYYYIDKQANWASYTKVWIKPVEVWHSDDPESGLARMSQESQQMLADSLHVALVGALTNNYQMVKEGGPGVLVIRAAVTDNRPGKPTPGVLSSLYMPLKVMSYGQRLVTGNDIGVRDMVVEAEVLDGQSNQRLAASMDERVGEKALPSRYGSRWEDVKRAFDWWAQHLARRLGQAKAGDFSGS